MSFTHEQLKKNVNVSRKRLESAREKRLESVKLHKRHKVLNVGFWIFGPISVGIMAATFPVWVFCVWLVLFVVVCRMAWKDLITARNDIRTWREHELQSLSNVTEDIQALVDRETLQLMDPERYAAIEREYEDAQRMKLESVPLHNRNVYHTQSEVEDVMMELQAAMALGAEIREFHKKRRR